MKLSLHYKNVLSSEENVEKKVKAKPMGWGLKKPRKSSIFPEKVQAFLTKRYEGGEKGRKANPSEVAEEMRFITRENGSKVFSVGERLSTAQITSLFSRMASGGFGKASLKEKFDDSDLLAALAAIEEDALIENINCMPCKWFYNRNSEGQEHCDTNTIQPFRSVTISALIGMIFVFI